MPLTKFHTLTFIFTSKLFICESLQQILSIVFEERVTQDLSTKLYKVKITKGNNSSKNDCSKNSIVYGHFKIKAVHL